MMLMNDRALYASTVMDLCIAFYRSLGDIFAQFVAKFEHRLDEQRLAQAFQLLQESEPILACRLVIKPWRATWQQLAVNEHAKLVVVQDQKSYESFRTRALEALDGPQIQACLFRDSSADHLMIKTTHEVCDAGGTKDAVWRLAEIYNRLSNEPHYRPSPNTQASRGLDQVLRTIPLQEFPSIFMDFRSWRETLRIARQDAVDSAASVPLKKGTAVYPQRHLSKERMAALTQYGKRYGATINDLFLAAMFRVIAKTRSDSTALRLNQTVDLRRYLPTGRAGTMCNLSGVEFFTLPNVGNDYADTLTKVVACTAERKRHFIGINGFTASVPLVRLLPPPLIQKALDMFFHRIIPHSNVPSLLTNTGPIPVPAVTFDEPAQQAWIIPPAVYPPIFAACLSGYQGAITLNTGTYAEPGHPSMAESFLDLALAELPD